VSALLWPLLNRSAWAQPATLVTGTKAEGAALATESFFQSGLSKPLWWRARHSRSLLCPLFACSAWAERATVLTIRTGEGAALASVRRSAWAQPDTVVAGTKAEGADLDTVRTVGVGSASQCGGGNDM
jgi:hypothetical protein